MQKQLTAAIKESLSGFKKPQPTQEVYFDTLQHLQNEFPLIDRWQLRTKLLAEIEKSKLGQDEWEIERLLLQALAEVENGFEERQKYEMGGSNDEK